MSLRKSKCLQRTFLQALMLLVAQTISMEMAVTPILKGGHMTVEIVNLHNKLRANEGVSDLMGHPLKGEAEKPFKK